MSTPKSSTKNGLDAQLTPDEGEVALALSSCLTDLIAQYDRAEAEFIHASKRSYTPEFKSLLANDQLTDDVRHVLVQQREDATGFDDEVEGRSAFAYAQVLALADEIIRLKFTSPAVLALKARACLWERSPENMHGDGGVRAARFLTQLAALQVGIGPIPSVHPDEARKR